jgi:Ca2+-binding RTX toxin-like protein
VDGKIVTASNGPDWPDDSFSVSRWNPTGTPDVTFHGGRVETKVTAYPYTAEVAGLAIQPKDGRIVVGGMQGFSLGGVPDDLQFTFVRYHGITCAGYGATMVGTPGNDTLRGTDGDDVIFGAGGDDRIFGFDGDDVLCGGPGSDTLFGGGGFDICDGGSNPSTGEDQGHGCEIIHNVP